MKEFKYVINDEQGIHARPAGELVKLAKTFTCDVKIAKDGGSAVDAKRIIGIMSLGAKKGHEVTLSFEGEDEEAAASALEEFFKANL